ncbi:MAG: 2-oxo acid dehydrogenase subunit E2 [Gammaproteobacteria bacterium]|nr:2-oxo acid dehydrogenase subunit E2 [Gammaproteobacteria bacterium]
MNTYHSKPLGPVEAYMYGLKSRAHLHHCLGNAAFPVDLTNLTAARKRYSREVRAVTLMPFFIKAAALSYRANPAATRILFQRFPFRRKIVQFDAVDINIPVTRVVEGEQVTFIGIIRNADKLSIAEIQEAHTRLHRDPPEQSVYLQKLARLRKSSKLAVGFYHWLIGRSPAFYLKNAGTCGVIPMDAMAGGHFFPIGPTSAMFGIGGVGDEVVARDGKPAVRRMLQASLALDNYVVSGPEGLLLTQTFKQLVESCSFVDDELQGALDEADALRKTA